MNLRKTSYRRTQTEPKMSIDDKASDTDSDGGEFSLEACKDTSRRSKYKIITPVQRKALIDYVTEQEMPIAKVNTFSIS